MFKKLTIVALALVFSGASIAAGKSLYKNLDANKDGTINQSEAAALPVLTDKWKELDANADGILDEAEFAKFETMTK